MNAQRLRASAAIDRKRAGELAAEHGEDHPSVTDALLAAGMKEHEAAQMERRMLDAAFGGNFDAMWGEA